jgi:hypothetical protein
LSSKASVSRRTRGWLGSQAVRYLVQAAFAVFIAWTLGQNLAAGGEAGGETLTSPEAFCPFGGFETLFNFVQTGKLIPHTHMSNLVLFGAMMLTAVFARSFFCGWVCPFGALQQLITGH